MGWLFRLIVGAGIVGVYILVLLIVQVADARAGDLRYVLAHAEKYAPPACNRSPCVLTGPGGIVQVWFDHVDRNAALGRSFVVKGVCASACRLAALRVNARLLPGARLVYHTPTTYRLGRK